MSVEFIVYSNYTKDLTATELISFLSDQLNIATQKKYVSSLIAKIKEQNRKEVIDFFVNKGYDIKTYFNSDYFRFSWKNLNTGKKGIVKEGCYPYSFELSRVCDEEHCGLLIYADQDRDDVMKHFNLEKDKSSKLFNYIDANEYIAYLIEEKGYKAFYEDGTVHIEKN